MKLLFGKSRKGSEVTSQKEDKLVLFVCVENAGRSQIAEAFFRKYAPRGYMTVSAGTRPTGEINPIVIQAMKEIGIDIINEPIEVRPVCHYMMGGIHTNIDGATEMKGLWAAGEAACNSTHGANRLGANSTGECLVWGKITGELAAQYALNHKSDSLEISEHQVLEEEKRIYDGIFRGKGQINPYESRKELTDTMDAKAHVFRNEKDLAEGLKKVREIKAFTWKHVDDHAREYNTNFTNVMELDSMIRTAEVVLVGALNRHESRGAHAMKEYPKRDDINFLKHTLAYYTAYGKSTDRDNINNEDGPKMDWFPVTFTRYTPVERHY
jgi:succinate dehydrogenase / fumarate reductase flavoprotein subunit